MLHSLDERLSSLSVSKPQPVDHRQKKINHIERGSAILVERANGQAKFDVDRTHDDEFGVCSSLGTTLVSERTGSSREELTVKKHRRRRKVPKDSQQVGGSSELEA